MPSAEEEDDAVNGADKLLWQHVLSWDYVQLCERLSEGKGIVDDLQPVPARFETMQVRLYELGSKLVGCTTQAVQGLAYDDNTHDNPNPHPSAAVKIQSHL